MKIRDVRFGQQPRLTLQARLALWSAILLFATSLSLVLFINVTLHFTLPRVLISPLFALPPTDSPSRPAASASNPPSASSLVVKGWQIQQAHQLQQLQQHLLQHILIISLGGALFILVIGGLGIYWLSGYVLRPVRTFARYVASLDPHELDRPFPTEGPDDEIRQLAEAFNQMLARLSRALAQQQRFISDAAHELRTPLATLRMTLETALAEPHASAATYRETMYVLDKALARLETITERLLLLTRNERQIVREDVYLWPLIEDVILDMEDLAASKAITVRISGDTELAVQGDPALLAIIFRNLIENAIYYNQQGGLVQIYLDQDRQDNVAVISIADTGIGIPPEEQQLVFSRFYRGRQARTYHPNGTGLGLSLITHLVQLHGGTLHLTSTPGQGSIFTIRLPL